MGHNSILITLVGRVLHIFFWRSAMGIHVFGVLATNLPLPIFTGAGELRDL